MYKEIIIVTSIFLCSLLHVISVLIDNDNWYYEDLQIYQEQAFLMIFNKEVSFKVINLRMQMNFNCLISICQKLEVKLVKIHML